MESCSERGAVKIVEVQTWECSYAEFVRFEKVLLKSAFVWVSNSIKGEFVQSLDAYANSKPGW